MKLGYIRAWAISFSATAGLALAQTPDHPIITEVFTDPLGANDAPVGRDPTNLNQEYIELFLPPLSSLNPGLNKDALRLTFYEVEGDVDSSGYGLVNYRIDLPTFDLDPSNGITAGAIQRPANGVVVIGWVDYIGNPPTNLAGTSATRIALINGGVTSTSGFTFMALNGGQFGGTTNFPVPVAISYVNMPSEASSGLIQNGSAVYLLVNRDGVGYASLTDDGDPAGGNHNPGLGINGLLKSTCLLDGWGPNDSSRFDVLDQPSNDGNNDNFVNLPPNGPYSLLVCQLPENDGSTLLPGIASGYARYFVDVRRTTEDAIVNNNNPVTDSLNSYRQVRNYGPFFPTPGQVVLTNSAPELSVASGPEQSFGVLAGTTAHPAVLAANVGGNFGIDVSIAAGASSNPAAATFGGGTAATGILGQKLALPTVSIAVPLSAVANSSSTATLTATATNSHVGDPAVVGPIKTTQATATVLKPNQGLNALSQPFQTTVFAAIQPILSQPALANEFAGSSLAQWIVPRLGNQAQESWGHAAALLDPATNIGDPGIIRPMVRSFPDATAYINPAGPPGRLSLVQTVVQSAEVLSGATSYDETVNATHTGLRGTRVNFPDTLTFGGSFSPSEAVYFFDPAGHLPTARSGLYNANTMRGFEIAILETNVGFDGTLETGATDDVGIVVEVLDVEPGASLVTGEFVFLSFTGGLQGADLDGTEAVPGASVIANIIYLDLDNLHDVLGVKSLEQIWLVDAGGATNEIEPIETFSLNPVTVTPPPCPGDINGDRAVDLSDLAGLLAHFGLTGGATLADGDLNGDGNVDLSDLAFQLSNFGLVCP